MPTSVYVVSRPALCFGVYVAHRIVKELRRHKAEVQAAADAEAERLDGLRARADQQQAWRMAGDPRGIYGESPPQGNSLPITG
jgi:hypothetical protein